MAESARGGRAETPEIAVQSGRGATNGGSMVSSDHQAVLSQVSSGDPVEVLAGLIEVGLHPPEADCVQCENARRTAARILAADWRPPLPVGPHPGREELGHRVCEVALKWSREQDDRPGATATWEELTPEFRELHMRVGETLFALGMVWSPVPTDAAALLSRLADLTEAAGKARSTEWLRTCSTLPMEEWPPAPAYKGPMVPAAELAEAKRQHAELLAQRDSWWDHVGREQSKVTAERDALQARIDMALEWWRQERDADHCWPLSFEDSAKVNSLRYRLYAALTGHQLAAQPMPAEPAVTPPDPSGRIVDGGPVQPFADTDHQEPNHG